MKSLAILRLWLSKLKIKWFNRKSRCWSCEYFDGYYCDEITYECKKHKTCMWGAEDYCRDWKS